MGSFRIVSGSGINRHEISNDLSSLTDAYETLKALDNKDYSRSSSSSHYTARRVSENTETMGSEIFDSLMADLERKANKWALETLAEFRSAVPVDTGNLRDSLAVTNKIVNKSSGRITVTVGVDEDKILPPPSRMRRRNGKMRTMPDYDYSPYVIGDAAPYAGTAYGVTDIIGRGRANIGGRSITSTFYDIAIRNAKKIF
jgi:hypothetical protein